MRKSQRNGTPTAAAADQVEELEVIYWRTMDACSDENLPPSTPQTRMEKVTPAEELAPSGSVSLENRRDLSFRLDEVMDMVGASESMRQLHRMAATTEEVLLPVGLDIIEVQPIVYYQCGSSYEGTVTPGTVSDVDIIHCLTVPSVVTHHLMAGSGLRLLMVRDDWTYPGYVKLQGLQDGQLFTYENAIADEKWGLDRRGRVCLKYFFPSENKHGPADMQVGSSGKHLCDRVLALKCDSIPPFAAEWMGRRRSHGWPSEEQLDEMRNFGCMVVEAGFYKSPEKDVEWRISFSLQERFLMKSLNIYQHKVYILLKLIKKNILEHELHGESLSSYHCKTCVFYMAESTPARMWTQEKLIDCLLECLGMLLKWLRNKCCPSYFIKEQNLFEKEGFERFIEPLQRSMDMILQSGHQFLYMLQSDRVGEILRSRDFRLYRQVSNAIVNEYIFEIRLRVIRSITTTYRNIMTATNLHQKVIPFLVAQLETIQSQDRVSGHTPEDTKAALRYILPWLHLHIGIAFACRAVTCSTKSDRRILEKTVDSHFRQARDTDFANVPLARASILLQSGKSEDCLLMLQDIEASWSSRVIGHCICKREGNMPVPDANGLYDHFPPMRDISVSKLLKNHFAACVVFLRSQSELVPQPLQYEMFRSVGTPPGSRNEEFDTWYDWAEVDSIVYLYFMQYLVCLRLDRKLHKHIAMDSLASLIQHASDHSLHHKETAYNLLGWIYLQEHRTTDAARCFLQSWQIRPQHNAAKFHILNEYRALAKKQP